jgi:hypothetical protein
MDALSQTFSALADPTAAPSWRGWPTASATVGELAEPFDMSLPRCRAISRC